MYEEQVSVAGYHDSRIPIDIGGLWQTTTPEIFATLHDESRFSCVVAASAPITCSRSIFPNITTP